MKNTSKQRRVLFVDIETAPIAANVWRLFDENIALNQIQSDWHLLSWAAKWQGENKVFYEDQSKARNVEDDRKLLKGIWKLLDSADIVIGHNSVAFDTKKLNARFLINGMSPPAPYKNIDTYRIAKGKFGFTSNKLAYLSDVLCPETKKFEHKSFPGFELWKACLAGNKKAWAEMKKYNIRDVHALEAIYNKLRAWDTSVNIALDGEGCRSCGGHNLQRRGFDYTTTGKQQRFQCTDCGAWCKSGENLLSKKEKQAIKRRA